MAVVAMAAAVFTGCSSDDDFGSREKVGGAVLTCYLRE